MDENKDLLQSYDFNFWKNKPKENYGISLESLKFNDWKSFLNIFQWNQGKSIFVLFLDTSIVSIIFYPGMLLISIVFGIIDSFKNYNLFKKNCLRDKNGLYILMPSVLKSYNMIVHGNKVVITEKDSLPDKDGSSENTSDRGINSENDEKLKLVRFGSSKSINVGVSNEI